MSWLSSLFSSNNTPAPYVDAANQQTKLMEQQQAKHDADVAAGKQSIDDVFTQFNPEYYDNYKKSYLNAYNPQLQDQYGIAKDKLVSALAGRDTLESSVGANALSQLDKTRNNAAVDIGNSASDAANGLRSKVDSTKSNLYSLNASAADPLTSASRAQSEAGAIVSPQSYPTLTDVFAGALAPFSTGVRANAQSMNPVFGAAPGGQGNQGNGSNRGSAVFTPGSA